MGGGLFAKALIASAGCRHPSPIRSWRRGVKRWGESSEANYAEYADFLLKWGVIKEKISAQDLITNELIDEINRFEVNKIADQAKAYRFR